MMIKATIGLNERPVIWHHQNNSFKIKSSFFSGQLGAEIGHHDCRAVFLIILGSRNSPIPHPWKQIISLIVCQNSAPDCHVFEEFFYQNLIKNSQDKNYMHFWKAYFFLIFLVIMEMHATLWIFMSLN